MPLGGDPIVGVLCACLTYGLSLALPMFSPSMSSPQASVPTPPIVEFIVDCNQGGAENIFKDAIPENPENLEARPPPPPSCGSGTQQNLVCWTPFQNFFLIEGCIVISLAMPICRAPHIDFPSILAPKYVYSAMLQKMGAP